MSYYRKRAALACAFCRSRKRRCDAQKPSCSNCVESEVECYYDELPSGRIDTAEKTKEIISRLGDIEEILKSQNDAISSLTTGARNGLPTQPVRSETSPQSPASMPMAGLSSAGMPFTPWQFTGMEVEYDQPELPPLTIPINHRTSSSYLLGLPSLRSLIGEYPPDLLYLLESKRQLPDELSFKNLSRLEGPMDLDKEDANELVSAFFSTAHPHHPILDEAEFAATYRQFLELGPGNSIESALCLTVLALGEVCVSHPVSKSKDFGTSPPGMEYMQRALPTLIGLSAWSFSSSILLPQALVLASVYFAYIVRPLHSWRLIYSASTILQFKLSGIDTREEGPGSKESIVRLYWSCFLIECDRLAELELPRTGLQQLSDEIGLPTCENLEPMHSTCYLAEISVRRLLNRVHNSLYPRKKHVLTLSATTLMASDDYSISDISSMMSVCDELSSQLETWHSSIPEAYRPTLEIGQGSKHGNRQDILRIRYYASRHIIYRPFVLYIATHGSAHCTDQMMEKAAICLDSCRHYIHNTTVVLQRPSQYTWTFSASTLGAIIILTLSSLSPALKHLVPDVFELQTVAIDNVRRWAFSSLEAVVSILEDIQKKQRLLSQV